MAIYRVRGAGPIVFTKPHAYTDTKGRVRNGKVSVSKFPVAGKLELSDEFEYEFSDSVDTLESNGKLTKLNPRQEGE